MALDPSYFFYSDGSISLTNGSDIATGNFTAWDPAVLPFDFVFPNNGTAGMTVIKEVLAMDQIRLAKPWTGPTLTDVPYFMVRWTRHTDPRIYALRVSDYLTRIKAIPEDFEAVGLQVAEDAAAAAADRLLTEAAKTASETARSQAEAAQINAQGFRDEAEAFRDQAQQAVEDVQMSSVPDASVSIPKLASDVSNLIASKADQITVRRLFIASSDIPNNVAYHDFDLPDGYERFFIGITHIYPVNFAFISMRFFLNGTEQTSNYLEAINYTSAVNQVSRVNRTVDRFQVANPVLGDALNSATISLEIAQGSAGKRAFAFWQAAHWQNSLGVAEFFQGGGFPSSPGKVTRVRLFTTVNLGGGRVTVEGLKST
jgi:hypothetical protein